MSYASLAFAQLPPGRVAPSRPTGPILPAFRLNTHTIAHKARAGASGITLVLQSMAVAGILWTLLAAPGLLTDRNSTTPGAAYTLRR